MREMTQNEIDFVSGGYGNEAVAVGCAFFGLSIAMVLEFTLMPTGGVIMILGAAAGTLVGLALDV